jgi:hypothetical protein
MNETEVTTEGLTNVRPGREALTGVHVGAGNGRRQRSRGEPEMVPRAEFRSYYGLPILNKPVWKARDIGGYLFLGGLAGAGAVVAAGAALTGRPSLARSMKLGTFGAVNLSVAALIHDLGRPARFLNMLRTFKPTSPMSVGTWLLSGFGTASAASAFSEVTGRLPKTGVAGTAVAAALGPAVATYTAALVCNTAIPAWHDAHRDMPWVFASSAATSAAALGLMVAPIEEAAPVRSLGAISGAAELLTEQWMEHRMGLSKEAFKQGRAKTHHRLARALLASGVVGLVLGGKHRVLQTLSGAALLLGSACTRFAIFEAGIQSAEDPRYTVLPQRERLRRRGDVGADDARRAASTPEPH